MAGEQAMKRMPTVGEVISFHFSEVVDGIIAHREEYAQAISLMTTTDQSPTDTAKISGGVLNPYVLNHLGQMVVDRMEETALSVEKAAKLYQVSPATVKKVIRSNKLRPMCHEYNSHGVDVDTYEVNTLTIAMEYRDK